LVAQSSNKLSSENLHLHVVPFWTKKSHA